MKILHITESYKGGVASAIESFVSATSSHSHYLLYSNSRGSTQKPKENYYSQLFELHKNPLRAALQIRSVVKKVQPDVVHLHSSFAGVYGRLFKLGYSNGCAKCPDGKRRVTPRIVYSPHCFAFERQDVEPYKQRLFKLIERTLASRVDAFGCCSLREVALASQLNNKKRAVFVPNVSEFEPSVMPFGSPTSVDTPLNIVTVGRVSRQKNPEMFTAIAQDNKEHNFIWIGDGEEEDVARLKEAGVVVKGWKNNFEVEKLLKSANVYLHVALWEGFPISIVDAVKLKLPTIAKSAEYFEEMNVEECLFSDVTGASKMISSMLSESARQENVRIWDAALENNTKQEQREALLDCYFGTDA
ncbi:MAG: glycosyltransferase [Candidatus Ancillula sp.]|jgi:glycosyltransferase involved in cell wall biosynthesis|nr:glycosyltransferase [Candidatus Ancillula sp.]